MCSQNDDDLLQINSSGGNTEKKKKKRQKYELEIQKEFLLHNAEREWILIQCQSQTELFYLFISVTFKLSFKLRFLRFIFIFLHFENEIV